MANHKITKKIVNKQPKHKEIRIAYIKTGNPIFDILTVKEQLFCREYIWDWNGTRAYKKVYQTVKNDNVAAVQANRMLRKVKIMAFIEEIQKDLSKLCGISKQMIVDELRKMAFTSIAHLHNTWITLKEFNELTEDQKASIHEIDTKVLKKNVGTQIEPSIVDVEYVRIKLFDKAKSIEIINKMLGNNAADELKVTSNVNITWNEEKSYTKPGE
jgi:phage terminase small subunit